MHPIVQTDLDQKQMKMKLFVWTGFQPDYSDGLAFAIAETEAQARELVSANEGGEPYEWGTLQILPLNTPIAFQVSCGS